MRCFTIAVLQLHPRGTSSPAPWAPRKLPGDHEPAAGLKGIPAHLCCCGCPTQGTTGMEGKGHRRPQWGRSSVFSRVPPFASQTLQCSATFGILALNWYLYRRKQTNKQKLLQAFHELKKKKEDAWHETNWTGCPNNWIFRENCICSNCFSSHLPTWLAPARSQPSQGLVLSPWKGIWFVAQLSKRSSGASQASLMPVLHLDGVISITFGFKLVQTLPWRWWFRITFAPESSGQFSSWCKFEAGVIEHGRAKTMQGNPAPKVKALTERTSKQACEKTRVCFAIVILPGGCCHLTCAAPSTQGKEPLRLSDGCTLLGDGNAIKRNVFPSTTKKMPFSLVCLSV